MPSAITTSHLRRLLLAAALLVLAAIVAAPASGHRLHAQAHAAAAQQCAEHGSAPRDPANPLALASAPGADPLTGAHFFVDGPAHGAAAGAIATLLGMNPASLPDSKSWASFDASLGRGALAHRLASNPGLARRVHALAKIAAEPEVQRLSAFSRGGGPGGGLPAGREAAVQEHRR